MSDEDFALRVSVDAALNHDGYYLLPAFASPEECAALLAPVVRFAQEHYTPVHLASHACYVSDSSPARHSYAFALQHPDAELKPEARSTLPCIESLWTSTPLPSGVFTSNIVEEAAYAHGLEILRALTRRVLALLGVARGRLLFNVQRYWARSLPVLTHRDGEVFEASTVVSANRHEVVRALYPRKVALLTLLNSALHGGTRLTFADGSTKVIEAQAGDLLIFDNVRTEHGVDELLPANPDLSGAVDEFEPPLLREIIGWRALEWDCVALNRRLLYEPLKAVSYDKAVELHQRFLAHTWPHKLAELRDLGFVPSTDSMIQREHQEFDARS